MKTTKAVFGILTIGLGLLAGMVAQALGELARVAFHHELQAAHAVASGCYAAVLPKLATIDLPAERFARFI